MQTKETDKSIHEIIDLTSLGSSNDLKEKPSKSESNKTESVKLDNKETIRKVIQNSIFELHYRTSHRPASTHIIAEDINDANVKGRAYCINWNLKFISVSYFFSDLDRHPTDSMSLRRTVY
jgi:hypothetical protein